MDIFNVLIIIALLAIAVFKQNSKKKEAVIGHPAKKRTVSSSFVKEEIEEKEQILSVNKPRVRIQHSILQEEEKKKTEVTYRVPESQRKHETGISLRTPADARRAFIYSEIFGRKYD